MPRPPYRPELKRKQDGARKKKKKKPKSTPVRSAMTPKAKRY